MATHLGGKESALRKLGAIFGVDRLFLLLVSGGDDMVTVVSWGGQVRTWRWGRRWGRRRDVLNWVGLSIVCQVLHQACEMRRPGVIAGTTSALVPTSPVNMGPPALYATAVSDPKGALCTVYDFSG